MSIQICSVLKATVLCLDRTAQGKGKLAKTLLRNRVTNKT